MDKAGKQYWDNSWATHSRMRRRVPTLSRYVNRRFQEFFRGIFYGVETREMKLIEIGCARSVWLPYFAKEFGFNVCGIDYSEIGCTQEEQILTRAGVQGEVVCVDFFSPPESMLGEFDVVVSFGVVEHYEDTAACIEAFAKFLKPNGTLITSIPNLVGLIGSIQKTLNRPVYDIHVPLDSGGLADAHRASGLEVVSCDYFIGVNFGVCNLNGIQTGSTEWYVKKVLLSLLACLSLIVLFIEDKVGNFKVNKVTSPYINCVARKKKSAAHVTFA